MKQKIISLLLIIFIIALVGITKFINNKKDDNLLKVRLAEVTHSSFYTPLYVAIEKGYFKEEGIDLELILTPGADKVSAAVLSNDVEIGFAGAESAIYVYNNKEKDYLQIFAGLTKRDGQFIVSRKQIENFQLTDLIGKEILVGRSSGMPALNFLNALDNNGINTKQINANYSVDFASLSGTFIGGTGDFVNLFEPNATLLEEQGYGYVVASVGKLSGEVPYTTFYARKSYIEKNYDVIKKINNAINKGITYTLNTDSKIVAKDIINQFPDTNIDDLKQMIQRYKEYDCWLENTFIEEKLFTNLEDFLIKYNLIKEYVPYNSLIINTFHD